MKDNLTPEEKLLRLIKGDKKTKPAFATTALDAPINKSIVSDRKAPSTQLAKSRPNLKLNLQQIFAVFNHKFFTPAFVRKFIILLIALAGIYLIVSLVYSLAGFKTIKLPAIEAQKNSQIIDEPKLETKPFEFYQQGLKNRQLFSTSGSDVQAAGVLPAAGAAADFIKDISLVGVISGDNPQAIIEDKKSQKTYYVSKGQYIGEFQVEDIQDGKIILNFRGQRYELGM